MSRRSARSWSAPARPARASRSSSPSCSAACRQADPRCHTRCPQTDELADFLVYRPQPPERRALPRAARRRHAAARRAGRSRRWPRSLDPEDPARRGAAGGRAGAARRRGRAAQRRCQPGDDMLVGLHRLTYQPARPGAGVVKLGVFGGEFDPPHVGHLVIAQEARFRLGARPPAGRAGRRSPPHRDTSRRAAGDPRCAMAEAAFAGEPATRGQPDRAGAAGAELHRGHAGGAAGARTSSCSW